MIINFRHNGLRRFYEKGERRRVPPQHAEKIHFILTSLEQARSYADMDKPGFRLHPLVGNLDGYWAVTITGNWRIVFRFTGPNVSDVDLIDYH